MVGQRAGSVARVDGPEVRRAAIAEVVVCAAGEEAAGTGAAAVVAGSVGSVARAADSWDRAGSPATAPGAAAG